MRVLVTGGAGFIGRAVVDRLSEEDVEVVVLDSLRPDVHRGAGPRPLPEGASLHIGDVRDRRAVDQVLERVDAVVHLAAKVGLGVDLGDLDDYVSSNGVGTAVLLQAMAAASVDRLVLASSMVVYGEGAYSCADHGPVRPAARTRRDLERGRFEPPCPRCGSPLEPELVSEDAVLEPRNGYAATKLHQEHLAAVWARESGGRAVALRFHNVYGPGLPKDTPYAGVAALFASALRAGEPTQVFEDGGQRRDFIDVVDVADAVAAALFQNSSMETGLLQTYNVGSGAVHTIADLARAMTETWRGPVPVITGRYRLGDVRHVTASSERIARDLGWRASVTFEEGVASLVTAWRRE